MRFATSRSVGPVAAVGFATSLFVAGLGGGDAVASPSMATTVGPSAQAMTAAEDQLTSADAVAHHRTEGSMLVSNTELQQVAAQIAGRRSSAADVLPLDSGDHCNQGTCENVKSQGGSGPYIIYWKSWSTQPGDTTACSILGDFLRGKYTKIHEAYFSGCNTVPPGYTQIWYGYYPASSSNPAYFAPGTQLCTTWHPNPPFSGLPCITVGS